MDGLTDGFTDGFTDSFTDGLTDGLTDIAVYTKAALVKKIKPKV